MSFPRLIPHLQAVLEQQEFQAPLPFQLQCLAPIKSGKHLFCLAPKDAGKTTALIISVIQKLGGVAKGDSPRAIIFVEGRESALALESAFKPLLRRTDLRLFTALDQHEIEGQKNEIYDGIDIIIGSPERLSKLFFINAINIAQMRMLIVEDADFLSRSTGHVLIERMSESLKACQFLVFAESRSKRFERMADGFMQRASWIE